MKHNNVYLSREEVEEFFVYFKGVQNPPHLKIFDKLHGLYERK